MFNIISNPKFIHDCSGCLFLGNYKQYDVYFCPNAESFCGGSIILRFGDDGPEYNSAPVSTSLSSSEGLTEASDVRMKVAKWLLRECMIRVNLNPKVMEEKREVWEDVWKMRKECDE